MVVIYGSDSRFISVPWGSLFMHSRNLENLSSIDRRWTRGGARNCVWPSSCGPVEDSLGKAVGVQMNFIRPSELGVNFSPEACRGAVLAGISRRLENRGTFLGQ